MGNVVVSDSYQIFTSMFILLYIHRFLNNVSIRFRAVVTAVSIRFMNMVLGFIWFKDKGCLRFGLITESHTSPKCDQDHLILF